MSKKISIKKSGVEAILNKTREIDEISVSIQSRLQKISTINGDLQKCCGLTKFFDYVSDTSDRTLKLKEQIRKRQGLKNKGNKMIEEIDESIEYTIQ